MTPNRNFLLLLALALAANLASTCSNGENSNCECRYDTDCPEYFECNSCLCVSPGPTCYLDEHCKEGECCLDYQCVDESECQCTECTRDEQCADMGLCMECKDKCCTSYACESDADCPETVEGPRYCGDFDDMVGCRRCELVDPCRGVDCDDPDHPLYVDCGEDAARCSNGACICWPPCGGTCPDGQYCCRQSQTCDPIPTACWGVECPPGEQVNPDPGGTLNEETCQIEGADCSCEPVHVCNPPCPDGSECADLDGLCEPECVLPTGKLACSDDSHCPIGGACTPNETCSYGQCSCIDDMDCPPGYICVDEDGSCGICVPRGHYECSQDSDCLAAIVTSRCCSLPMPRNVTTVENTPCFVEFPHEGPPPAGCEPDCSCDGVGQTNHCWPLPSEPLVVTCSGGVCRMNPEPGP